MARLVCAKCNKPKTLFRGFYQCTNPQCAKPLCKKCAGATTFKSVLMVMFSGGIKKGDTHPSAACPYCGSPLKFIG